MDNLLNNPGFWSIAGVIIGFLLGEGSRLISKEFDIKKGKQIIKDELRAIKFMIPLKIDILSQCSNHIANKQVLAANSTHILDIGYRTYINKIYKRLSLKQRNCLHLIYSDLRYYDEFMDTYEENLKKDMVSFPTRLDQISKIYETKLIEIKKRYEVTKELVDSYLADDPIDVFCLEDKR